MAKGPRRERFVCTADQVRAALRSRYAAPEYAIFFEVAEMTGGSCRSADAVAVALWPSRGLEIQGFEIKVNRSDWLKELRDPAKAEAIAQFCDKWWIVAAAGIVWPGELPKGWGLIELSASGLRQVASAPTKPAIEPTRGFIAALLRRAGQADEGMIREKVRLATADQEAKIKERVDREVRSLSGEAGRLKQQIADFEAASGLSIAGWHEAKELGTIVRCVKDLGVRHAWGTLAGLVEATKEIGKRVDQARRELGGKDPA